MRSLVPNPQGWTHLRSQHACLLLHQGFSFSKFPSLSTSGLSLSLSRKFPCVCVFIPHFPFLFFFFFIKKIIILLSVLFMQNLEAELCHDSSHHDDDLSYAHSLLPLSLLQLILQSLIVIDAFYSVDDLKVFTEDELMDMALKQVFEVRSSDFSPFFFFHSALFF